MLLVILITIDITKGKHKPPTNDVNIRLIQDSLIHIIIQLKFT